jgi:hypothetical protein
VFAPVHFISTLTIGEDSGAAFTGGTGNDTFNAPIVQDNAAGTVETLESFDVLDGGAGTDTLNATINTATPAAVLKNIENVNVRFVGTGVLDLANATGVEVVTIANSAAVGTVEGLGAIANLAVKTQSQNAEFDDSTATTLNVTLDTFGKSTAANNLDLAKSVAAKATTINYTVNNTYAGRHSSGPSTPGMFTCCGIC